MSVKISPNLPANVVEIGQELAQATLDGINNAESPSSGNPMITQSALSGQLENFITDAPFDGNTYARQNGGWTIFTPSSYDANKAIANLCASCFTSNGITFQFTNYVALAVAQSSKFTSGSQYVLGLGTVGSAPTYAFSLTYSSPSIADTGVMWTSASGQSICYSDNYGSTWTYADLPI